MKLTADELKTEKRWFSTERVIKLQNFLPQEFKETKHYISAEGNCRFVEEESSKANTYSCSGNPASANCWGFREYSGEVLLYIYCVLTCLTCYLLLAPVSEKEFEWTWTFGSCSVQPFLCCKACPLFIYFPLCYLFFRILSVSSPQTFAQNGVLTCLAPLVTCSFLCVISCVLTKYKISMKEGLCSEQGQECRYRSVNGLISCYFILLLLRSTFFLVM